MTRFTGGHRCPVCRGCEEDPRGEDRRCWGFLSDDGQWAHCTREEHAGDLAFDVSSATYAHRLTGVCHCGVRHNRSGPTPRPHARQTGRQRSDVAAVYDYRDEEHGLLFQVVRLVPKDFRQRRPWRPDDDAAALQQHGIWVDAEWVWSLERLEPVPGTSCRKCQGAHRAVPAVRRVLYRLPELLAADPRAPVYLAEGEKDAENLRALGLVATTNPGGALKWRPEYGAALCGRRMVLLPDNDVKGRAHRDQIVAALADVAAVFVVELPGLPAGGDVSDWLAAGGTREQLEALIATTSPTGDGAAGPTQTNAGTTQRGGAAADGGGSVVLATVEPEPVTWLWPGRIPLAKVTLLEGDPDEGKSCVALTIAACVSRGTAMPGETAALSPTAGVVYVTAEDGLADTIRPRFDAAGGDPERVRVFDFDDLPDLDAAGLSRLEAAIRACDARLLVLDPLNAFLPDRVDTHQDKSIRRALRPLAALAVRTGAAVLVIRHLNKSSDQKNPKYRGGGTIGIFGAARAALLAAPDPDDPTRKALAVNKHNLTGEQPTLGYELEGVTEPLSTVRVKWLGPTPYTARDLLAERTDDEERTALDEAVAWLRDYLTTGPKPAAQTIKAAEQVGIAARTVQRARAKIATAWKDGFQGAWVWALKGATAPSPWIADAFGNLGAFGNSGGFLGAEVPKVPKGAKDPKGATLPEGANAADDVEVF
jgi:putative DNA primase/helicase